MPLISLVCSVASCAARSHACGKKWVTSGRKAGGVDLESEGPILGERRCCSTNRGAEAIVDWL